VETGRGRCRISNNFLTYESVTCMGEIEQWGGSSKESWETNMYPEGLARKQQDFMNAKRRVASKSRLKSLTLEGSAISLTREESISPLRGHQ